MIKQLFEYAFHEGIPFCVLTDGRDWNFYLPSGQGSYDERRLYRLNIEDRTCEDAAAALANYLDRSRVVSGEALDDATRQYRQLASGREARRIIPSAWTQLVVEREELLIDLISDQVETLSGFKPSAQDVTSFLDSLGTSKVSQDATGYVYAKVRTREDTKNQAVTSYSRNFPSTSAKGLVQQKSTTERGISFLLFGEAKHEGSAQKAMLVILSEIAKRRPDCIEKLADAAKGRSRNHIARSVAEIYPSRPDLAKAEEFAPGWLVGLNIANREKKRIIKCACEVAGFGFGSDVVIELPNS